MTKEFENYKSIVKELMLEGHGRGMIAKKLNLNESLIKRWMTKIKNSLSPDEVKQIEDIKNSSLNYFLNCQDELIELMKSGLGRHRIALHFDITKSKARRWMEKVKFTMSDNELDAFEETVRLSKTKQKLMDKNRIREKVLRESFRIENAWEEYNNALLDVLTKHKLSEFTIYHDIVDNMAVGIIHISDVHFNELIHIENVNRYDFNIASKRFYMLAQQAKRYFKMFGITNILIAMTGDLMNSDRRLDELLSQSTNRSNATFVAVDILQQFIRDLNQNFNINVACVTGNESRVANEQSWSKTAVTDNYDLTIFNILKYIFKGSDGVKFIEGNPTELVINIGDCHILMIHGHGSIKKDVEKSVEQIKGRYAARGQIIDYIIFGHLHSARIGDVYARCSSMAGANAYSEELLNLTGKASQNLYLIHDNGLIDGVKVDLQITEGQQYHVEKSLEAYNCKSSDKLNTKTTIFKVVI